MEETKSEETKNEKEEKVQKGTFATRVKELTERVFLLENSLKNMLSTLEDLNKKVDNIKSSQEIAPPVKIIEGSLPEGTTTTTPETKYPIPMEYREIIATVLNNSFGIQIEPMNDSPAFTLMIVVPDKYSNMTPAEREMYKVDMRPKVLTYAEGVNGVRMWAEKVFNNFSSEVKAQIVADRALLK
jgi:hypothetical protein